MEQVLFGGYYGLVSTTSNRYNSLAGGYLWRVTEADHAKIVSTDGVIKNLRVKLNGSPGAGKHYDFTLMLNGAPTALTLEIADAAVFGSNMVNEITVTGGDTVSIRCAPSGSPNSRYATWTSVFEGDTEKESLIMGGGYDSTTRMGVIYGQVMGAYNAYSIEVQHRQVVPTAGTIKNFYVKLKTDPGTAPDAFQYTLRKNGVSQTLSVTITANDTTGNDLVNSFDVVAGDVLTMLSTPLNSPAVSVVPCWGMTFVADVDGESIIMGGSEDDLHVSATEYNDLMSWSDRPWTPNEAERYQLGQVCTLRKLYILMDRIAGAGNKYDFTIRIAGANSNVVATVSGADFTGNSGELEDTVANDDYVTLQAVPTTPDNLPDAFWGFVCYTGPPPPPPSYIEKFATFAIAADAAWTDYDLFTNQGVPKGRVAEIVCCNKNADFARICGVRTDGSALNRYIDIHEAEGGGVGTATMFVKCHATTGLIECYSEIQGDVDFVLLGYFAEGIDFTESITSLGNPGLAWADKDLTASGVPDDAVVQILMGNENTGADFFAGVRENGSALERGYTLDEAEGGSKQSPSSSWSTLSMVVQSDAGAVIEWKGGSVTDITMWLLGWFSSSVSFTEGFTDYSPAVDNTWEEKIITESAVSSVLAFALVHQDSGKETFCGLREDDSILARMIEEHEAEGGSSTGFQACVQLDPYKKCEVFCADASEAQFSYTGYFIIAEAAVYETSARLIGTVIAPYSAQVRNIGSVYISYSARARLIGTVLLPFSTQVRNIGNVVFPYSSRARLIGTVLLPFTARVRNIGTVIFSYSSRVRLIGMISLPYSSRVRMVGSVYRSYSSSVRNIGIILLVALAKCHAELSVIKKRIF